MPDSKRAQQALWKFVEWNDRSIYRLIKNMMDPSADYKYILKHFKEIIKRLSSHSSFMSDILTILLRRACVTLVGKNSIPLLLEYIAIMRHSTDTNEIEMGRTAECIIKVFNFLIFKMKFINIRIFLLLYLPCTRRVHYIS